jgi:hypothetical protein
MVTATMTAEASVAAPLAKGVSGMPHVETHADADAEGYLEGTLACLALTVLSPLVCGAVLVLGVSKSVYDSMHA